MMKTFSKVILPICAVALLTLSNTTFADNVVPSLEDHVIYKSNDCSSMQSAFMKDINNYQKQLKITRNLNNLINETINKLTKLQRIYPNCNHSEITKEVNYLEKLQKQYTPTN